MVTRFFKSLHRGFMTFVRFSRCVVVLLFEIVLLLAFIPCLCMLAIILSGDTEQIERVMERLATLVWLSLFS